MNSYQVSERPDSCLEGRHLRSASSVGDRTTCTPTSLVFFLTTSSLSIPDGQRHVLGHPPPSHGPA